MNQKPLYINVKQNRSLYVSCECGKFALKFQFPKHVCSFNRWEKNPSECFSLILKLFSSHYPLGEVWNFVHVIVRNAVILQKLTNLRQMDFYFHSVRDEANNELLHKTNSHDNKVCLTSPARGSEALMRNNTLYFLNRLWDHRTVLSLM